MCLSSYHSLDHTREKCKDLWSRRLQRATSFMTSGTEQCMLREDKEKPSALTPVGLTHWCGAEAGTSNGIIAESLGVPEGGQSALSSMVLLPREVRHPWARELASSRPFQSNHCKHVWADIQTFATKFKSLHHKKSCLLLIAWSLQAATHVGDSLVDGGKKSSCKVLFSSRA